VGGVHLHASCSLLASEQGGVWVALIYTLAACGHGMCAPQPCKPLTKAYTTYPATFSAAVLPCPRPCPTGVAQAYARAGPPSTHTWGMGHARPRVLQPPSPRAPTLPTARCP